MIDAKTLQEKLAEHLHAVDLTALDMFQLSAYADAVAKYAQMSKPDWTETFATTMAGFGVPNVCKGPEHGEVK